MSAGNQRGRRPAPSRTQIRRRRRGALAVLGLLGVAVVYLVLINTIFAPVDEHGARTTHLTIHSAAVGQDLGVNVVEPAQQPAPGKRSLLVFLHGHGGSEGSYTEDEAVFKGLARLGARAPIVAFPGGGEDSYWHDRADGDWGR